MREQAEPLGGGQLLGSGRMWVAPAGELDPRAVRVRLEGRNLPADSLLKRYLPKVVLACLAPQFSRAARGMADMPLCHYCQCTELLSRITITPLARSRT